MLIGFPTKYGSGVTIFGDYFDLKNLHGTIHELAEGENAPGGIVLLEFAYECRKAYSDQRENKKLMGLNKAVTYYGFKCFWPNFLAAINILQQRLKPIQDAPHMAADVSRLEAIAKECLLAFDEAEGRKIISWLMKNSFPNTKYFDLFVYNATNALLHEKAGKARFMKLLQLLKPMVPMSPTYNSFVRHFESEAKKNNCEVSELSIELDFDEDAFKW